MLKSWREYTYEEFIQLPYEAMHQLNRQAQRDIEKKIEDLPRKERLLFERYVRERMSNNRAGIVQQ